MTELGIKGFLLQAPTDFSFIGLDRKPIRMDTVDKYITIADIIASTRVLNFQQARFLIKSGLNIEAWEKVLT